MHTLCILCANVIFASLVQAFLWKESDHWQHLALVCMEKLESI
jgi:prolyl-tRNA synthetase